MALARGSRTEMVVFSFIYNTGHNIKIAVSFLDLYLKMFEALHEKKRDAQRSALNVGHLVGDSANERKLTTARNDYTIM